MKDLFNKVLYALMVSMIGLASISAIIAIIVLAQFILLVI